MVLETCRVRVPGVLDVAGQSVGGTDGVLASNNMQGSLVCSAVDALGDNRGYELEDVRAYGASDDVGGADRLDQLLLVGLGVDGPVVGDCVLGGAF